ncbi:MAG: hypothetical protein ACI4C1_07805 [Lachnospiraceae bacterium]
MICGTEKKNAKVCQNCGFDETKNFMHYSAAVPITSKIEENFQKDIRTAVEKSVSKQKAVLQGDLMELQRQIEVAKAAKETAERESEENKLVSKQKAVLQKELTELQQQIAVAKAAAGNKNQKLKQLQTDIKALTEQKSQMEQLIADKKESYNKELDSWYSIYVQNFEEKTKLTQLKGSRETEEKAYNEIAKKRDEAQKEYDEIVKKRDDVQKEYNTMVQKRNAEEKKLNSLKSGTKTVIITLIIAVIGLVCVGVIDPFGIWRKNDASFSENWQQVNQFIEELVAPYETTAEMGNMEEMTIGQKVWNVVKAPICVIGILIALVILWCIIIILLDTLANNVPAAMSTRVLKLFGVVLGILLSTGLFLVWCFMIGWVSQKVMVDITILGRASVFFMIIGNVLMVTCIYGEDIDEWGWLSWISLIMGALMGCGLTELLLPIGVAWIRNSATGDVLISQALMVAIGMMLIFFCTTSIFIKNMLKK